MKTPFLPRALVTLACLLPAFMPHMAAAQGDPRATGQTGHPSPQATLDALDAELQQAPDNIPRRFMKAVALSELGRHTEALDLLMQLSREVPAAPEPLNNMAVLYAKQGRLEEARQALTLALEKDPDFTTAHENLGDVHARLAEAAYEKVLQLAPGHASVMPKLQLMAQSVHLPGGLAFRAPASIAARVPGVAQASVPASPAGQGAAALRAETLAVEAVIRAWAAAWSRRDATAYLRYYAPEFTPAGLTRAAWDVQRRERIAGKTSILVRVNDLQVTVQGDQAHARFIQHYTAGPYRSRDQKSLRLVRATDGWKILGEATE